MHLTILAVLASRASSMSMTQRRTRRWALQTSALAASTGFLRRPASGAFYDSAKYDEYARTYDALDGGAAAQALGLDSARAKLAARARGKVLEVGAGTGLNVPFYGGKDDVTSLELVDASTGMLNALRTRLAAAPLPSVGASARLGDVARLDFAPDGSYDTVVDTFSLCVYEDPEGALREMGRVVKPKSARGQILLLENSRPRNPLLGAYTDATADFIAKNGGKGCRYNQDVAALAATAGLTVERDEPISGGFFRSLTLTRPG